MYGVVSIDWVVVSEFAHLEVDLYEEVGDAGLVSSVIDNT